jgi:hypothetical protein
LVSISSGELVISRDKRYTKVASFRYLGKKQWKTDGKSMENDNVDIKTPWKTNGKRQPIELWVPKFPMSGLPPVSSAPRTVLIPSRAGTKRVASETAVNTVVVDQMKADTETFLVLQFDIMSS